MASQDPTQRSAQRWAKARFDPHTIRQSHRSTEVQIRKQNRTDRLRQRRGIQVSPEDQAALLRDCAASVDDFLQRTNATNAGSGTPASSLDVVFRKHHPTTEIFLRRFLKEHEAKSRTFVKQLLHILHPSRNDSDIRNYALSIVIEMTASLAGAADTKERIQADEENYYGRPPLRWDDLFFSSDTEHGDTIVAVLATILSSQEVSSSTTSQTIELVQSCWMYWAEYAPDSTLQATVPTHWALLVSHLPLTAPCCAAILQRDHSHYGMDLLSAGTFDWPHLLAYTPPKELQQLPHHQFPGARMLEGLCRRESAVGDLLCCDPAVVAAICQHVASQPPLLPVVHFLLAATPERAPLWAAAIPGVVTLLDAHNALEAVPVLYALQGREALPRLLPLLVSHPHPWKCEVMHALAENPPPFVEYYVSMLQVSEKDDLMRVFVELLRVNDTAHPTLTVLDCLLRNVPESHSTFEEQDGVETLERFSLSSSMGPSELADIAGHLVDDLFDNDDDDIAPTSPPVQQQPFTSFSFAPPQGRGRGRTVPAWQQNQR